MANIIGTNEDDVRIGTGSSDTIAGLEGNDRLLGLTGIDIVNGGSGTDTLVISYSASTRPIVMGNFTATGSEIVGFPPPGGVTFNGSGGSADTNGRTGTYTGFDGGEYDRLWWGPAAVGGAMDGEITNGTDEQMSLVSMTDTEATWKGQTSITFFDGSIHTVYTRFVATIVSGAAPWQLEPPAGAAGGPQTVVLINGDTFVVNQKFLASFDENGTYVAFNQLYNDAPTPADAQGQARSNVAGQFAFDDGGFSGVIDGSPGNRTTFARIERFEVVSGSGNDSLHGEDGDDMLSGLAGFDLLAGRGGDDILLGGTGQDRLDGGAGNDSLDGGADNDILDGGTGIDTANYFRAGAGVRVSLAITGPQFTLAAGTDTLTGFENLLGSNFDDQLTGNSGDNVLTGNAGNDVLLGGAGNDVLNGGNGVDATSYAGIGAGVTVSLATSAAQDTGAAGIDTLLSIENLTGTSFDDALTGSAQANVIVGGLGNDAIDGGSAGDTIDGGSGNDMLKGSAGDDLLIGYSGNDLLGGGAGIDTISYQVTSAGVKVDLSKTGAQLVGGGNGTDTIVDVENVIGSGFGDTLTGNAAANVLTGGGGADILAGGGGNDRFAYLATADSTVGAGADRITDLALGDVLDLSAIDADSNSAGSDQAFVRVGALTGTAGQFTLAFSAGSNTTTLLADSDGNGAADFSILFTGDVTGLTAGWVL